jgi:hypothetical protein
LTLYNDSTFKFHDQGCYGQNFTEGNWSCSKERIILSSFENYKQKSKKSKSEFTFVNYKKAVATFLPEPDDTIRIYFDKVNLKLSGDTLNYLDKNQLLKEHKFVRLKQ